MAEVNIRMIAQEAGVSISLVSQVLNDRPVRVSPETRNRIKRVAEQYHYIPNKFASCLKKKETKTIALLAPFTPYGFFSNLIYNVQKYAFESGYLTMVINTFENEERERDELRLFRSGMFDGMIIAPLAATDNGKVFAAMQKEAFPFVFVDRFMPGLAVPLITSDHEKVGYELTRKAIADGKRQIAFVYRMDGRNSAGDLRLSGYQRALAEAGLESHVINFTCGSTPSCDVANLVSALRNIDFSVDTFFVHSGYYLPLLVKACRTCSIDVSHLSFLTVDAYSLSASEETGELVEILKDISGHCYLAVQDIDSIAKYAVKTLISQLEGAKNTEPHIVDPGYLSL